MERCNVSFENKIKVIELNSKISYHSFGCNGIKLNIGKHLILRIYDL